jgi:hypothetical protein
MAGLLIRFILDIEVRSDPTMKQLYQSDPKWIFWSEMNINISDRIRIGFAHL